MTQEWFGVRATEGQGDSYVKAAQKQFCFFTPEEQLLAEETQD